MKRGAKTFEQRLWLWFALFAAAILAALWLLQTVFLQGFYDRMVIRRVESAAAQIAAAEKGALPELLDGIAGQNALLIFLTDKQGNILYTADEHGSVYESYHERGGDSDNPYRRSEMMNWQLGASRYLALPQNYGEFLDALASSSGTVGYRLDDGTTYVYGQRLDHAVLYISTTLEAVGGTVSILRAQLAWVTLLSLLLAFVAAWWVARRFAAPVSALSEKAERLAAGEASGGFEKGFCAELDALSDTLDQTAEKLRRAESARRDFLANISHDLRTPLTMIRGYAEMVRDVSWENEAQRENDLSIIIRESDRLSELVGDILEYSALQAGAKPMEFAPVDLGAAARSVIEQFEPLCASEGYRIETDIEPDLVVNGDEAQLRRVFYNLLDNAISHAGVDKIVSLTVRRVGSVARVEVWNGGEAIPADELPHVWERYFTKKQRKRNQTGSGLGLVISKEILLSHGAAFGVVSEEDQGTVFWIQIERMSECDLHATS